MNGTANYDFYLFQRPYKVPTRSPTPTTTTSSTVSSTHSSSTLGTGALVGAIVSAVIGGILIGLATLGGSIVLRRNKNQKQDGITTHEVTRHEKMADGNVQATNELEDTQKVEMSGVQQDAREMYTLPVELPGHEDEVSRTSEDYHAR
jgi:hypothetical protein